MAEDRTGLRAVRVWDAPTRLFHWALALLVLFSWISVRRNWMQLHFLSGYTVLTLLLFRIAWGLLGSETARFARFLRSPAAALRHLAHLTRREPDTEAGHNAAGGWMVLLLLLVLAVQTGTGLFSNDDAISEGPFAEWAGKDLSDRISGLHALNFRLILAAVGLHVLAVAVYAVVKRQNLLRPMLTGQKNLPPGIAAPRMAPPLRAALLLAIAAAVVAAIVTG